MKLNFTVPNYHPKFGRKQKKPNLGATSGFITCPAPKEEPSEKSEPKPAHMPPVAGLITVPAKPKGKKLDENI